MERPSDMFDREFEWRALAEFAEDERPGATLGVLSGRRRQGKTFLLRALCRQANGFYFGATEATEGESLRQLGAAIGAWLDAPAPLVLEDWQAGIDALLSLGRDRPVVVVIDEFPYLVEASPALPSILQNALAPLRKQRDSSRARLLLCGSAISFMGRLLAGNAPLRGRAGLELVVPTFDHRTAAAFWGISDPVTALKVNAIVGGTPAYRREFARDDVPAGPDDFDAWVARTVLSRASPLFREARYLLADEPSLHDTGLYHSVLAAIAVGNGRRGSIAAYVGRKSGDLAHPLTVLEDIGLVAREPDVFKDNRTTFRIAEPLVTFYHAVMRPIWSDLEQVTDPAELWRRSQARFLASVVGPHFEHVARWWTRHLAGPGLLGDHLSSVGTGTVNDPANRTSHQLDVVAFRVNEAGRQEIAAIGEAKWNEPIGDGHLNRLRRIRDLLVAQGRPGAETARLVLYSGAGSSPGLRGKVSPDVREATSGADDVLLIELADLYART